MKRYVICRVDGAFDWENIPFLQVDSWQWQEKMDISMQAQICNDGENLFIRMLARESDIRAEHFSPLSMVCEDSCMEFFFRPMEDDLRYFNFEINPNAAMFIGFGSGKEDLVRLMPEASLFMPQAQLTEVGWEARYRIPAKFIRTFFPNFELSSGKISPAKCYKCGHKTVRPHYICWNEVNSSIPSFHRPEDFGQMEIE